MEEVAVRTLHSVADGNGIPRAARPEANPLPTADLRRLKILGIVPPIVFVVLLEIARFSTVEADLGEEDNSEVEIFGHIVLAVILVTAVIAFAGMMFRFIGRAQDHVLRQNRQLELMTSVSTAVRDDGGVEEIVDRALDTVMSATGTQRASVMLAGDLAGSRARSRGESSPAGCPAIDVALTAGTSAVGTMRLEIPAGAGEAGQFTPGTLQTIGRQVGYALQRAMLIGDLQRGKAEGHAFYEVLLQISGQRPLARTLHAITRIARDRLGADEAILTLDDAASRVVRIDLGPTGPPLQGEGQVCISPDRLELNPRGVARLRGRPEAPQEFPAGLAVPVGPPGAGFGDLWVGRRTGNSFDQRDLRFLATLAELTTIALNSARMLESERQGAIVAERERIARELHDSLAQVLGVTHLRLQALRGRQAAGLTDAVVAELGELADLCHEAYADVREAILGLGQGGGRERYLLDSLQAYVQAFSRRSGIHAGLDSSVAPDLVLEPRSEVQLVRIIQEALTNVRKHSGATHVVVRVTRTTGAGVEFAVEDDGHGFDPDAIPAGRDGCGFGLFAMSERVRLLGGDLSIEAEPGRGTCLRVRIPAPLVQHLPPAETSSPGLSGGH